jgi:hypothetical protein
MTAESVLTSVGTTNSFCDSDAHNLNQVLRLNLQQTLRFKRCPSPEVLIKTTVQPAAHEVVKDLLLKQALSNPIEATICADADSKSFSSQLQHHLEKCLHAKKIAVAV